MKFGIITSEAAEPTVREVLEEEGLRDQAVVVALPVPSISLLSSRAIASILRLRPDLLSRLEEADVIILPGAVSGSAEEVARVADRPAFKGPRTLGQLPAVMRYVMRGAKLDTVRAADEVLSSIRPSLRFERAYDVGKVVVPLRGPPVLVLAEVDPSRGPEEALRQAKSYVEEGADIIIVGADDSVSPGQLRERVQSLASLGRPLVAEAPTAEHARAALEAGADGLSIADYQVDEVKDLLTPDRLVIVGGNRLERLKEVEGSLRGRAKVMVDPSLAVPPLGLAESVCRYLRASRELSSPIMFSAANVTEDVEADTIGVHAILALLAVEVRASGYLVVEETYKSAHAVSEAKEALRLAELAFSSRSSERGEFSRLLVLKQDQPPPPEADDVRSERVDYIEPEVSPSEYLRIAADPSRGVVRASLYRHGSLVGSVEGPHALSVARAIIRRFGMQPEHAAYMGYELAKAEMALKLGKTYVQDEPLLVPPWDRNGKEKGKAEAGGC